jgi:hypothetical protein
MILWFIVRQLLFFYEATCARGSPSAPDAKAAVPAQARLRREAAKGADLRFPQALVPALPRGFVFWKREKS